MARTLKNFNTEEEYEEWVNSPYMRTPYTCLVKETGNVHYFDGDDDDYSITVTIKKTGWIRLGTTRMEKYIKTIYRNGEQFSPDSLHSSYASSFYYRKEKKPFGLFNYYEKDDFYYHAVLSEDNSILRGGRWYNGNILQYSPRRFARGWMYKTRIYEELRPRFMYVKKGDVVKIVFYSEDAVIMEWHKNIFGQRTHNDQKASPKLFSLDAWANEIVIGDGFTEINGDLLHTSKIKRVYFGKNAKKIYNPINLFGNYYKKKVFLRRGSEICQDEQLDYVKGQIVRI